MTDDPFPPRKMAIDGICMEIIIKLVINYEEEGLELKAGELSAQSVPTTWILITMHRILP
jgi:hypothetical protein